MAKKKGYKRPKAKLSEATSRAIYLREMMKPLIARPTHSRTRRRSEKG